MRQHHTPSQRSRLPGVPWLRPLARLAKDHLLERTGRALLARRRPRPGPPVIAGLLSSAVGIGEGARLSLDMFDQMGLEPACIDLTPYFPIHGRIHLEPGRAPEHRGGTLVIHMAAPELPRALIALGRAQVRHRRVVGYWAWELPRLPRLWRRRADPLDEIWVPSHFVADAVLGAEVERHRVHVVPHPIRGIVPPEVDRTVFCSSRDRLVFLCLFDALSSPARKNPWGAIETFRRAFGERRDVELVVKASHADRVPGLMSRLQEYARGLHVRFITDVLDRSSTITLIACADVLLSLHRAEGFGLHLAEAMSLGKPVVATRWSGNLDFMNDDNSVLVDCKLVPVLDPDGAYREYRDLRWAEPNIEQAAAATRRLAAEPRWRERLGDAARRVPEILRDRFAAATRNRL